MIGTSIVLAQPKTDIVEGETDRLKIITTVNIDPTRSVDTLHDMTKKDVVGTVAVIMKKRREGVIDPLSTIHMLIQPSYPTL